jgi:hypothetical protein
MAAESVTPIGLPRPLFGLTGETEGGWQAQERSPEPLVSGSLISTRLGPLPASIAPWLCTRTATPPESTTEAA